VSFGGRENWVKKTSREIQNNVNKGLGTEMGRGFHEAE